MIERHELEAWLGPAVAYPELAGYSDAELMRRDIREVIAEIEAARAAVAAAGAYRWETRRQKGARR